MGLKITGIDRLTRVISNVGKTSSADCKKVLEQGAKNTKVLAQQMAPVDKMNLEKAIRYRAKKGGQEYEVYVDTSRPIPGRKFGETVGNYAMRMHEGVYNLGKRSLEKQAQVSTIVGRKYFTRAFTTMKPFIMKKLEAALRKAVRTRGR